LAILKGARDFRSAYKRDKEKVQKKMGGGMTAGSMSGMGRLQKARMMSKGGLKTELNNPAKGYTKGGMADYYKDLM
jgi:hypothetical protein